METYMQNPHEFDVFASIRNQEPADKPVTGEVAVKAVYIEAEIHNTGVQALNKRVLDAGNDELNIVNLALGKISLEDLTHAMMAVDEAINGQVGGYHAAPENVLDQVKANIIQKVGGEEQYNKFQAEMTFLRNQRNDELNLLYSKPVNEAAIKETATIEEPINLKIFLGESIGMYVNAVRNVLIDINKKVAEAGKSLNVTSPERQALIMEALRDSARTLTLTNYAVSRLTPRTIPVRY